MADPHSISIRGFRLDDIDAMIDLFRLSVRIIARQDYTHAQVMAWAPDQIDRKAWMARYTSRQAWVAETDDMIGGFSDLEQDGHLNMMYVHPAFQGRGIATALLEKIQSTAHDWGLLRLYTEASITARPFFERRGFNVLKKQTVSNRGQDFVNYRMEKDI